MVEPSKWVFHAPFTVRPKSLPSISVNADVAQLVEQRFRKPQVTGSTPVVGCHARRLDDGGSFDPSNFFVLSYGWADTQSRTVEIRRLDAWPPEPPSACRRPVER